MKVVELHHQVCRICMFSGASPVFTAREMMFGLKDEFVYFQCAKCQCLQISEFPSDMSRYYQQDYYSLSQSPENLYSNPVVSWARRKRDRSIVLSSGLWGKLIQLFYPAEDDLSSLSRLGLTRNKRIVDVGCGTGFLLYFLKEAGFDNVLGLEPQIDADKKYPNGLTIQKSWGHELDEEADVFMFHHSFEHLPNPIETLVRIHHLLPSGGVCLLRIPLVSSEAWKKYGAHWVQLDAPRHFFLYSVESLKILAERTQFKIKQIVYDSNEFQFWGSEQYLQGVPLMSEKSYGRNPAQSLFSKVQIKNYRKMADKLNIESQGDQAVIYLVKN
jgi:SAM-dependent methyltransferase